jgi:hypothetical protein
MTEPIQRNYDPDQFDWDGEETVVQDQIQVEEVEALLRSALAVTTPVEDRWLRPSAVDNDRARVQYNVPYTLDKDQKEGLEKLVGETRTLTYNASGYHDHPISHCLTEISEDMVVRTFGSTPFVSVWGNQTRHRRSGHVGAKVVTDRNVPHDWFRSRAHHEMTTDVASFIKARGHMGYRLFLCTQALYYMRLEEVALWMAGNPDAEFHAIVHRHSKSHGRLNHGELQYTTDSDGIVTQTNPLTGFKYKHRSVEPLFHVDSCRLFGGSVGLTWDINRLAGDNYHIKFVLCDPLVCHKVVDPYALVNREREVFISGDVTVYRALGFEWYVYHNEGEPRLLEDVDLYDRLRRTIAGKARTPAAKADLMAMCRRLANKQDIISIHQGFYHQVAPEDMALYVEAAFHADVQKELEVALKFHRENKKAIDTLNAWILEGRTPVDLTVLANIGKAVALPFTTLSGLLNQKSCRIECEFVSTAPHRATYRAPPDPFGLSRKPDREKIRTLRRVQ